MHGLLIGGVASGCGKTTVTLALMAALCTRGHTVQGFKVGPDYIDPGLHALVTGRASWNLDSWMCGRDTVIRTFHHAMHEGCAAADMGIVEGVMGLFDGASGKDDSGSSAEIAAWLGLPVVLVVDARSMARSVAAIVRGYTGMRADLRFAGVLCTRVGSANHAALIRDAFAASCPDIPLLGCLPYDPAVERASRHLGLLTAQECPLPPTQQGAMATWLTHHVDLDALIAAATMHTPPCPPRATPLPSLPCRPRIAIARDAAFCFMYPALPAALTAAGAEVVYFSPLADADLPPCDGVWVPGGYPELHAPALAANNRLRAAIRAAADAGLPIHGECGGYIWLMDGLETPSGRYAMTGCLPGTVRIGERRAALGYRGMHTHGATAFGPAGTTTRGHEFHYGVITEPVHARYAMPGCTPLWQLTDRQGAPLGVDGCVRGCVSGSWAHLHPEANPHCMAAFVAACACRSTGA